MKPLVSILIPCYNAEQWLADAIESALAQTWRNIEIIVVDDGSTDASVAIAKQYESRHIKLISQHNQGASAARNTAYRALQGDFIQYLDADDLLAPDKVERQIQQLESSSLNYVAAGEWARFYKSPNEAQFIPQPLWADMPPVDWLICAWEGHWMMHPAAWLVPRSIAEKAGLWDETLSLNDDGEYFCRVVLASQGIQFCWGAKTYYRSGLTSSLSGSKSYRAWKSAFHALELCTSNLLAQEDTYRTRHACATAFQRFIYEVYPDSLDLLEKAEVKVKQFGGSTLKPTGGFFFQLLTQLAGWRRAKTIQHVVYRYGYRKAALGWRLAKLRERLASNSFAE